MAIWWEGYSGQPVGRGGFLIEREIQDDTERIPPAVMCRASFCGQGRYISVHAKTSLLLGHASLGKGPEVLSSILDNRQILQVEV